MVPSARLELAQLSPLPPQDSVSTNFTTTALKNYVSKSLEDCAIWTAYEFNLKKGKPAMSRTYFVGICAEPVAAETAGAGTAEVGMVEVGTALSSTLPVGTVLRLPK